MFSLKKNPLPTITEAFLLQAKKRPEAIAIVLQGQAMTYGTLHTLSNQLARWMLHRLDDQMEKKEQLFIPLCFAPGLERMVAILAILKLGGAYVPIDPDFPASRIQFMLEDIDAPFLLTDSSHSDRIKSVSERGKGTIGILEIDRCIEAIRREDSSEIVAEVGPESLCYVMYTSGTTGRPKGVMITHQGVTRLVLDTNYIYILPEDGIAQLANIAFDASTFELWGALLNGARAVIVDKETTLNSQTLSKQIQDEQISVVFMTTGLFNQHVSTDANCFRGLRYLLFGGEAASIRTVRALFSAEHPPQQLVHVYGPTENTTFSTFYFINSIPKSGVPLPIGKAITNSNCRVVNEAMEEVEEGELLVGGPGLALGYLNNPELTAAKFINNPFGESKVYRTGDVVRKLASGELAFIGRVDNQVKIRGFRIELEEVERALDTHPDIGRAALMVLEDGAAATKRLAAYLLPQAGQELPPVAEIRDFLKTRLPAYMLPSVFYQVDAFPLSPTGKVDRKALAGQPARLLLHNEHSRRLPRTDIERRLCRLLADCFGRPVEEIGIEDDFFLLGGDSLMAIQFLMELKQKEGIELPVSVIFKYPTIESLAASIADNGYARSVEIPPWSGEGALILSPYQEQIWLHQQLAPDVPFYNEPISITMNECIDVALLQEALQRILQRHEALRVRFEITGEGPIQRFPNGEDGQLEAFSYFDLRYLPKRQREEKALTLATAQAKRTFNLADEQPIRFCLVRLRQKLFRLYLTAHHLVIDGVSIYQVFLSELEIVYRNLVTGAPPELPDFDIHYRDWLAWVREGQRNLWEKEKDYWCEKLKGMTPAQLPTDKKPQAGISFVGARYCLSLPSDLIQHFRELSRQNGASLFMGLLSAFKVLLYRYTQQRDLTIGSVVANRNVPGTEKIVADFVNTLLLRTALPKGGTFLDVLACVRETCLEAYTHQNIPYQHVVQALHSANGGSDRGQINVAFVMEPFVGSSTKGWELSQLDVHTDTSKFDLTIELDERDGEIIGRIEYRTDLFEEDTIARLVHHYEVLLRSIVESPDSAYAELLLLSEADRQRMLVDWNDTEVSYEEEDCLHAIIERQVDRTPEATAVLFEGESLSYAELDRRANQLAHHLITLGAQPDQIIVVWTDRSADHIVALLGVLKAGAAYVPVGADDPVSRVAYILKDTSSPIIICDEAHRNHLPEGNCQFVDLDADQAIISGQVATRPKVPVNKEHLAYIIYTSGSTGRPKGVLIEHGQIADRTHWAAASFHLNTDDVFLHLFSLAFDGSVIPTWWALNCGATVLMPTKKGMQDPTYLAKLIKRQQVTTICATPTVMSTLVKALTREKCPGLRVLMTGGESLSGELLASMQKLVPRVLNFYGPTEATVVATEWDGSRQMATRPPIGMSIANTRLYVLDSNSQPVPVGVAGELYIGGKGVARGYLNRPDLTKSHFLPDPFLEDPKARVYRTGDVVRYLPTGEVDFLGRADDQVKIRGFRIELGEIESMLRQHEVVEECAVIVRENKSGVQQILCYYVPANEAVAPDSSELRAYMAAALPSHMVPATFIRLSALPLTANGKLDIRSLPAVGEEKEETAPEVAPRTEIERHLAILWTSILEVPSVGIHDNFFHLGGHSLMSIQLVARAAEAGLHFKVSDLLEHRTIACLAQHVSLVKKEANHGMGAPHHLMVNGKVTGMKTDIGKFNGYMEHDLADRLVELKMGTLPALFFVHPAGGSTSCYKELAPKLDSDQAVYGIEAGTGLVSHSIESLAGKYLEAVRRQQPEGPYFLGGWSFGGIVALEMTRQLEECGEEVELLTLIDSIPPTHHAVRETLSYLSKDNAALLELIGRNFQAMSSRIIPISYADISAQPADRRENWFVRQLLQEKGFTQPMAENFIIPFIRSFQQCMQLLLDYEPTPCQAHILFFRARDASKPIQQMLANGGAEVISPETGIEWSKLTRGNLRAYVVPGTHETMIFEPFVEKIAKEISRTIQVRPVQG